MIDFGAELATAIPKHLLLELDEGIRAAGRQAKTVTGGLEVGRRSAGRVRGQIRTALVEQLLVRSAEDSGFAAGEAGTVPGTELYLHQAFVMINRAVLVRATQGRSNALPSVNKSRKRLVENFNSAYTRDLFRSEPLVDAGGPIAVFLVIAPDPSAPDGVGSVHISVVDDRYDHFLFEENLEAFLSRYAVAAETVEEPVLVPRAVVHPYVPPGELSPAVDDGPLTVQKK
jgi:hypothetical protein